MKNGNDVIKGTTQRTQKQKDDRPSVAARSSPSATRNHVKYASRSTPEVRPEYGCRNGDRKKAVSGSARDAARTSNVPTIPSSISHPGRPADVIAHCPAT